MADVAQQPVDQVIAPPISQPEVGHDASNELQQPPPANNPPVDAGWTAFVQQHSSTVPKENDTVAASNDNGWQSFLDQNADKAKGPSLLSQVGSGIGEAAHVVYETAQGTGAGINEAVAGLATEIYQNNMSFPKFTPNQAYEQQISDDLKQFHNSRGYIDSTAKFGSLVGDIVMPNIKNFVGQAYIDQAKITGQNIAVLLATEIPKDEYGNPVPESIEQAIGRTMEMIGAPFQITASALGFDAASQIIAQPIAEKLYPNSPELQRQFSQGLGQQAGQLPFFAAEWLRSPPPIQRLQNTGVLSGDEDAYFNEPSKTPLEEIKTTQPTSAIEETSAVAPKSEEPEKPKTIHDVVRENEPDLFKQYDNITDQQERLRGWLTNLSDKRGAMGDVTEVQGKIDIILGKVKGIEYNLTKRAANTLEDLRDQLNDIRSTDTPDMATIRAKLVDLDKKKRDMSEQVSAAYRTAQEQMPKETAPEVLEPKEPLNVKSYVDDYLVGRGRDSLEHEQFAANNADDIEKEFQARKQEDLELKPGEKAASLDIGAQIKGGEATTAETDKAEISTKINIASDIAQKLVAAGRPVEEAEASGQIAARMYGWFADIYRGTKGSAEDLYEKERPDVKASKEKPKVLAQGALGKIRLATDAARSLITLAKNANASTFIHENAHHFLDMMDRFSKEDNVPEALQKDMKTIREWSGLSEKPPVTPKERAAYTRAQEKFARGFERYLMEGLAPSKDLADVFAKFKKWMTDIYQTVMGIPNQKGGINPDIRDFFDRVMTRNPERIIIAPERETSLGKNISDTKLKDLFGNVSKAPQSLSEWLADKGGLKDETGDLKAMDADKAHLDINGKPVPFAKKLVKEDGQSLEDAARAAQEAGYFPEKGDERPTPDELLTKLREDLNGNKQYSDKDHEALNNYNEALKYNSEVDRISHDTGIGPEGKTHDQFWDAVAEYYNHLGVYNQAQDMAEETRQRFEEFENKERGLIESRGDAWEPEKENQSRTLEDLENERQQEIAASNAAKNPTASSEPTDAAGTTEPSEAGVRQSGSNTESAGRSGENAAEESSSKPNATDPDTGNASGTDEIKSIRVSERDNAVTGGQAKSADTTLSKGKSYYVDNKGVINFDLFKTPEDFQRYLQEYADNHPDQINEAVGGIQTLDKVVDLSRATGLTTKELLNRKVGELYDGPKQVAAAQFFIQQTEKLKAEADSAHASGDPQKILDFMNSLEDRHDYINMFLQQKGLSAEASRALGARRAIKKLEGFQEAMNVGELFQRMTGVKMKDAQKQADLFAGLTNPDQIPKLAQKTREANWRDYMIAYRNNDILSGPITHLHYADGNLVNLLYKPAKVAAASVLPGGPALGEAGAMYNSMIMGSQKAWLNAKVAWQDGIDISYQDISENYKRPTQTVYNQTFDKFFGVNSPVGKSIRSLHTFFYTMNSEMIKAQYAFRQALQEGLEEKTDTFNNRVSDLIINQSPEMMAKIDVEAKEAMYLKNPDYNSFLGHFNAISNRTYVGRALLPFAKIEMNVKLMARDNTILGLFSKDVRADLRGENGQEARAIRIAGMSMGTSLFGLGIGAGDKFINGSGPSDREQRKIWLLTHTPNSIQIGDISIPLRALGTPGQILLAGAEIKEAIQDATEPEANNMAAKFMEHVSNVAFKGTFIQNASDTVNAFTNPGQYGMQYLQNTASGFVPYASLLGQGNRYIDPFQRDVRSQGLSNIFGITDYVKSRIPFASETLQPRVDVLGNPIPSDRWLAAGSYDQYLENPVVQGMTKLGLGLTMPKQDIMGVKLSGQQYNDYAVTSGTLIQQRLWNTDSYGVFQEPGFDELSHKEKVQEVHNAIKEVRKSAVQDMITRYPEIGEQAATKKEADEMQ